MKILKPRVNLKDKALRFSLIICLGFCLSATAVSNPILPPPMILEIYFSSDNVFIELLISEYYGGNNLDNIRMTGLYDTAQFLPGIEYTPGVVFYVTQYDFETPIYINPAGDILNLEEFSGGYWSLLDFYGFKFGDLPEPYSIYSGVSAPVGEESVAWQRFIYFEEDSYWTVKDLPNHIGYNPFQVSKRAEFSGYVKDKNDDPLENVKLYYCPVEFHYGTPSVPEIFTDENGYFFTDNMFCKKYFINFIYDGGEIGDTVVFLEPDSANYFDFKLDTLLTGVHELQPAVAAYSINIIPNPSSSKTTFIIESNDQDPFNKGIIKIYNEAGFIVDIVPVDINSKKQELLYSFNDKSLASGLYFCNLEIGHRKMASGKMVISR